MSGDPDAARGGRLPQVHLSRLKLTDFRNYARLSLELKPGAVVFTGENGAGKTNLLEAISILSPGRGLRRATIAEVTRDQAASGFAIHATIEGPFGECEIGTGTTGGQDEATRKVRINGTTARSGDELLDWLRVIWLTPAMDALFTGPAGDRRRFLDRLVLAIDPAHGRRAADYEKAMRARNRLLTENSRDTRWFEAIETQMAETGTAIAAARAELVRLLAGMIGKMPGDSPFPRSVITLSGTIEEQVGQKPAVEIEEGFRAELAEGRYRDRAAGRTLDGPHRADLLVRHAPKDQAAELCSTGEQKALLIGIVLSHARLTAEVAGSTPVLLLDEIAAHLDAGRRAALFSILDDLNCQYFMTGTEAALFDSLIGRAQFLTVSAGRVSPTAGP
jgi:DNA replication and repair protein RecF